MHRIRVMVRGFGEVLESLGQLLPPWVVATVAFVLLVAVLPAWVDNVRSKQVRGAVRRMVRASDQGRLDLAERAMRLAGRRPTRLTALVEHAHRYQQLDLRRRGLAMLQRVDPAGAEHLLATIERDRPKQVFHPLEVVVRVERLLDEGMIDAAAARLDEALARYPDDPDLLALRSRLRSA